MACQLGLDRIVLSNARKLPRDYFGSSLLRKPETLRGLLVEELTISSDVSLPCAGSCSAATAAQGVAAKAQRWSAVVSSQVSSVLLQRSSAAQGIGSGSVAAAAQLRSAVLSSQGSDSAAWQRRELAVAAQWQCIVAIVVVVIVVARRAVAIIVDFVARHAVATDVIVVVARRHRRRCRIPSRHRRRAVTIVVVVACCHSCCCCHHRAYDTTPLSSSKFNRGVRQIFEDMEISVK